MIYLIFSLGGGKIVFIGFKFANIIPCKEGDTFHDKQWGSFSEEQSILIQGSI